MKKKYSLQLGKKEKEILKLIGGGVLFSAGLMASVAIPGLPTALAPLLKDSNKKSTFKRSLNKLEEKNLIYLSGERIKISKRGMEILEMLKASEITIKKTKWDRTWRIVAYDIPNKFKNERDYFRRKLINLGFKKIQESIWVIPYECKEEIAIFVQSIGLSPFVMFMTTDHLPKQKTLIKHFNL